MAKISRDDVLKLAVLARLELTDAEITALENELDQILAYVEKLQQTDTSGLEPTHQVTGLENVTRPDKIASYGYDPEVLLKNVPEVKDRQIKVKRMVD